MPDIRQLEEENRRLRRSVEEPWRESPSSGALPPVRLSDQVIGWMIRNERRLAVNDPANAPFPGLPESDPPIRSLLAAPLRFQSRLMGLIALLNIWVFPARG